MFLRLVMMVLLSAPAGPALAQQQQDNTPRPSVRDSTEALRDNAQRRQDAQGRADQQRRDDMRGEARENRDVLRDRIDNINREARERNDAARENSRRSFGDQDR